MSTGSFQAMVLLALIAGLSCFVLLTVGGMLGYAAKHLHVRASRLQSLSSGAGIVMLTRTPAAFLLHPRMDMASGLAPRNQAVDLEQQRSRHHLTAMRAIAATPDFEPFASRQRQSRSYRQRLDLLYAQASLGDLSDPVAGCTLRLRA